MNAPHQERAPPDLSRISLRDEWELLWWCNKFDVKPEILCAAVDAVGPDPDAVRKQLDQR